MNKIFSTLLLLMLAVGARSGTIDSLYHLALSADKIDRKIVNQLFVALDADGVTDSLIVVSRADDADAVRQSVCYNVGLYYNGIYRHFQAVEAFVRAAHFARQNGNRQAEAEALSAAAVQYHNLGDFEQSMRLCSQALHIDSLLNDIEALSCDFNILSATAVSAGRTDDAVRYVLKAVEWEKSRPTPTKLAIRYGSAAEILNKSGDTDQALHYVSMAYELDRRDGNSIGVARRLSQMADIYVARSEFDTAERYYKRAIDTLELRQELHSLGIDYRLLGNLLQKQNRHDEALFYYGKAKSVARQTGNRFFLSLTARAMAESQMALKRYAEATDNLQLAIVLGDSLHSEKLEQMAISFRSQFDLQEAEEKAVKQEKTLRLQQWAIVLLGLLLMGAFFVAFHRKNGMKKHKTAASIEENTPQEITDETINKGEMSAADRQFLIRVSDFVHTNMKSRKITNDLIAQEMCMSRNAFSRRLAAISGETPNSYITRIKMEKAVRLLRDTNLSVKEVAYECGFDESNYFIHVFRQMYGSTPQQFRQTPKI
ncbi:MAG: helix-turn-helix domain-containing protein [Prevotella sp.]|nr:helix-turn-helix domain-containing protein [Prevotella sp.]